MKKIDPFFVVVFSLFCGLATAYISFDYHLSGIKTEQAKTQALQRKVNELAVQLASVEHNSSTQKRGIASVAPVKDISLDGLYKEQMRLAREEKDSAKVMRAAQKIIEGSSNPQLLPEAYFRKAEITCATFVAKENSCLADIEVLVGQFPESPWTGEALVILSSVYTKQKRYKEASSLIEIVKSEFANQKQLVSKASQLEKLIH